MTSDIPAFAVKRTLEMAAVFMIGDRLLGVAQRRRHVDLWRSDAKAVDGLVRPFADRPARHRLYGLLQAGAGLALVAALQPRAR